eukprot:5120670-Prymnesium_polylepis.1
MRGGGMGGMGPPPSPLAGGVGAYSAPPPGGPGAGAWPPPAPVAGLNGGLLGNLNPAAAPGMPSGLNSAGAPGGGGPMLGGNKMHDPQQAFGLKSRLEPPTQEQVYNVQQVVVQLTQNGSNKHELRKVLQNFLAQERVVEAHLLLSLLQQ